MALEPWRSNHEPWALEPSSALSSGGGLCTGAAVQRRALQVGAVRERSLGRDGLRPGLDHRDGRPAELQGVWHRHVGHGRRGAARAGQHWPRLRVQGQLQPEHRRNGLEW
eukprot:6694840-Prymnesium_polylepis.2